MYHPQEILVMKLTKTRLKQIIKEEIEKTLHLSEDDTDPYARSWERQATRDQSVVAKDKGTTFKLPKLLAKIKELPSFKKLSKPQQKTAIALAKKFKLKLARGTAFTELMDDIDIWLVPDSVGIPSDYYTDLDDLFSDFSLEN